MATADLVKALRWAAVQITGAGEAAGRLADVLSDRADIIAENLEDLADELDESGPVADEPTMYDYVINPDHNPAHWAWDNEEDRNFLLMNPKQLASLYHFVKADYGNQGR